MLKLEEFTSSASWVAVIIATLGLGIWKAGDTKTNFGGTIALQRSDIKANHLKAVQSLAADGQLRNVSAPVLVMLTSGVFLL